jgi:uncharacterized protein YcfJ
MNATSAARITAVALLVPVLLGACRDGKNATADTAAPAPASAPAAQATTAPAPAHKPVHEDGRGVTSPAREEVRAPEPVCADCGTVTGVRSYQVQGQGSGIGIAIGAVAGGLLGHQIGGGTGNKIATVAGAVGGGYAGNEIEKRRNSQTRWDVSVRMDDGNTTTLPYTTAPGVSVGQKVRVVNGQAIPR